MTALSFPTSECTPSLNIVILPIRTPKARRCFCLQWAYPTSPHGPARIDAERDDCCSNDGLNRHEGAVAGLPASPDINKDPGNEENGTHQQVRQPCRVDEPESV